MSAGGLPLLISAGFCWCCSLGQVCRLASSQPRTQDSQYTSPQQTIVTGRMKTRPQIEHVISESCSALASTNLSIPKPGIWSTKCQSNTYQILPFKYLGIVFI